MRVELHVKSDLFEPCMETQSAAEYAVQTEDVNFNQRNLNDLYRPCQDSAVQAINQTVPPCFKETKNTGCYFQHAPSRLQSTSACEILQSK